MSRQSPRILLATLSCIRAPTPPAFIVTQRALLRVSLDDPRRPGIEERQNGHLAAATAWVVSLLVGHLLSLAALITV